MSTYGIDEHVRHERLPVATEDYARQQFKKDFTDFFEYTMQVQN
jgi:hypothetical protein